MQSRGGKGKRMEGKGNKKITRSLFLNSLDKMDLYVLAFSSRNRTAI